MNQGAYLSKTLWIYKERGEYVDVTLVCNDKKIPAHITVLAPLLSYFGIKYHCIEDVPGVIILPELKSEEVQEALRSLYAECKILRFQNLLDSHSFAVKAEPLEKKQDTGTVSKRRQCTGFEGENTSNNLAQTDIDHQNADCEPQDHYSDPGLPDDNEDWNVKAEISDEDLKEDYQNKEDAKNETSSIKSKLGRPKASTKQGTKYYPCKKCDECFTKRDQRRQHVRSAHWKREPKSEKCPYCEKAFASGYLKSHIFNVHKDKRDLHPEIEVRFQCTQCKEEFHDKLSLKNHNMKVHTGPSTCKLCSHVCENAASLKSHMIRHSNKESFVCDLCAKEYPSKPALKQHIRLVHDKVKPKFQCKECKIGKYSTEERLQQHMLDDHTGKEYICSQCPVVFASNRARLHHEWKQHGDKTVKCDQCEKMFVSKSCMNAHISKTHTKEKKLICPHCSECFHVYKTYKAHVLRHSDSRQHSCEECGKAFLLKTHLKNHMNSHTLPFKCDQCDVRKGSLGNLKNHIRKVHDGVLVTCRHGCGWQCGETGSRNRHEKACHLNPVPDAPFTVSNGTATQYDLEKYHATLDQASPKKS